MRVPAPRHQWTVPGDDHGSVNSLGADDLGSPPRRAANGTRHGVIGDLPHSPLRTPGAAAFFLSAAVGRVGIAMTGLGIVWLVHARTGSYTTAGLVTGGFAVAEAAAGPQLARLVDRFGQSRVLPPALLAHAAAVAALLALVAAGTPDWLMTQQAGCWPEPPSPSLARAVRGPLGGAAARRASLGASHRVCVLESLANEVAYLAGPALVSILGASGYPAAEAQCWPPPW